jgi:hypothetical protein
MTHLEDETWRQPAARATAIARSRTRSVVLA